MGVGPNYVLDKGFLLNGSSAYTAFTFVKRAGDGTHATKTSAGTDVVLGVVQADTDAAKVATGKVVGDVRILGITRCVSGGAVAVGDHIKSDTNAKGVAMTQAAAGAQPAPCAGIAMTATTGTGQTFDLLLTPGATF
jgi:hypothetical protein